MKSCWLKQITAASTAKFIISSIESCFINIACALRGYNLPRYAATSCQLACDFLLSTPELEQQGRIIQQQSNDVVSRLTLQLT